MDTFSKILATTIKIAFMGLFGATSGALIIAYPLTLIFGEENWADISKYSAIFGAAYVGYGVGKQEGKDES